MLDICTYVSLSLLWYMMYIHIYKYSIFIQERTKGKHIKPFVDIPLSYYASFYPWLCEPKLLLNALALLNEVNSNLSSRFNQPYKHNADSRALRHQQPIVLDIWLLSCILHSYADDGGFLCTNGAVTEKTGKISCHSCTWRNSEKVSIIIITKLEYREIYGIFASSFLFWNCATRVINVVFQKCPKRPIWNKSYKILALKSNEPITLVVNKPDC